MYALCTFNVLAMSCTFRFIWIIILAHFSTGDDCRKIEFADRLENKALINHVIISFWEIKEEMCEIKCYLEPNCRSYNYGLLTNGTFLCELSNTQHMQALPDELEARNGFNYRSIEQDSCLSSPCLRNATCQVGFGDHGYHCVCPGSYYGDQCQLVQLPIVTTVVNPSAASATSSATASIQPTGAGNACFNNPAGVTDNNIISNNRITASGYRGGGSFYQPKSGRLNNVSNGKGWCAQSCCGTQDWLQIDFGTTRQICGVATQGDNQNDSWVITFKLSFSTDGSGWTFYKNADNTEKVFQRNGDGNTVENHELPTATSAKFIRFHPVTQNRWNCLRVEVYESEVVSASCEAQWTGFGSSCYKIHSSQGWSYARLNCENFGGKLVKIESEDENQFIKTEYLSGGGGRYWIGLSDLGNEGDWRWTDGTGITGGYEKWRSGQPNNHQNDQHCGAILKGSYHSENYNAEWNDERCSLTLDYICEK